jgi:DNA-binding transcriptional MocR family regulator
VIDTDRFYDELLHRHGTYVGPGHWFELDDRHFRLGFGWPALDELHAGLAALSATAHDTMR